MLRQELQSYFDKVYPHSKIETEYTLGGQVHIRFELGGELENGTQDRVNQATRRALSIFTDTFNNPNNEILVLIYEYQGPNSFNAPNDYLHRQFPSDSFANFYSQLEQIKTTDENGNEVLEQDTVRIIIGKLLLKDINIQGILKGIANTEMGFDPGINQSIYFFDAITDRAFRMYDDRGCFVWSNEADKIRDIYIMRNEWIVDYHRPEIDKYFKQS